MSKSIAEEITDVPFTISQEDEAELVREAQIQPEKFVSLYHAYVDRIYRYLLSRTGSVTEAEDLTAQTFLSALEGLPSYRHHGHFTAWLFTIARNLVRDTHRRKPVFSALEVAERHPTDENLLEGIIQREERDRLKIMLHSLPEREQDLIRLRFVAGLSFPDMARALGKNEERIKKRLYRLMARIERQMEKEEW